MERVTISMSDEFAAELAAFMADNHYVNRSEALRDLARLGLKRARLDRGAAGPCLAILSYVFDHHTRDLARRLTEAQHSHHDLQVATMHVHVDHERCLEAAVLRGDSSALRDVSSSLIAERGVTHGQLSLIPMTPATSDPASRGHAHAHAEPDRTGSHPGPEERRGSA